MEIETNSKNSMVFTTFCTQEIDSTVVSYCADAPTLVSDNIDDQQLFGIGDNFVNSQQGGYTTSGRVVTGQVGLSLSAGG